MLDKLFVYGTLEFPEVLRQVLGEELPGTSAVLFGFRRFRLKSHPFPGITAMRRSRVSGMLLTGLEPKHLRLLDRYEGRMYRRIRTKTILPDKRTCSAWVYILSDSSRHEITDVPWNKQEFFEKYLAAYLRKI